MEGLDAITRDDIVHAAEDITPLAPGIAGQENAAVALLNGNRYDPRALVARALQNAGGVTVELTAPSGDPDFKAYLGKRRIPVVLASALDKTVKTLIALHNDHEASQDLKKIIDAEEEVIPKYQPLFSSGRVKSITSDEIGDFLSIKNNKHWPLQRARKAITSNMDGLREALSVLVDGSRPINERLDEIDSLKEKKVVKGVGPATITAILHVSNPQEFGVWNGTSESGWIDTGLWLDQGSGTSFGDHYQTVNEILKALAKEVGVDLWTLDALWWRFDWGVKPEKPGTETQKKSKEETELPHLPDDREAIRMICEIARTIADADLGGKRDYKSPDAAEVGEKYDSLVQPQLQEFIKYYGLSPTQYLKRIIDNVMERGSLSPPYESQGFHFRGRIYHAYTWTVITWKHPEKVGTNISRLPQLFIGVHRDGVKFGFAYGDSVEDSDSRVGRFHEDSALQTMVLSLLGKNPQLQVVRKSKDLAVARPTEDITQEFLNGHFSEWTSESFLGESFALVEIPDDIVERIESTLSALVPLFTGVSEGDVPPPPPPPPQENIWADVREDLGYSFDRSLPFDGLHFTDEDRRRLNAEVVGALRSGKHIILTGPPGTGKSKVAKAICEAIAGRGNYHMCTASPDWSVFETIGGYRPRPDGTLEFHPGAFLRSFRADGGPANRWLIVDEINRADIDKAFGPLFSALAGDDVFLPFEVDSDPVCLIGRPENATALKECHFIIHPDWRIIATMNTYDKSSLYEMSYAFMRRFAFIMVDSPDEVDAGLVGRYVDAWKFTKDDALCQQVADLWNLVNGHRKIGPALFHDVYQFLQKTPEADIDSAIALFLFPQFEGLREDQQISFVKDLVAQGIVRDLEQFRRRAATFFHINPKGLA